MNLRTERRPFRQGIARSGELAGLQQRYAQAALAAGNSERSFTACLNSPVAAETSPVARKTVPSL